MMKEKEIRKMLDDYLHVAKKWYGGREKPKLWAKITVLDEILRG